MFSNLFYEVWPSLGGAFGLLSAIADMTTQEFIDLFFYPDITAGTLDYLNLFTGSLEVFRYEIITAPPVVTTLPIVGGLLNILFLPYLSLPVWATLVICSCGVFLSIYVVKFLLSFI